MSSLERLFTFGWFESWRLWRCSAVFQQTTKLTSWASISHRETWVRRGIDGNPETEQNHCFHNFIRAPTNTELLLKLYPVTLVQVLGHLPNSELKRAPTFAHKNCARRCTQDFSLYITEYYPCGPREQKRLTKISSVHRTDSDDILSLWSSPCIFGSTFFLVNSDSIYSSILNFLLRDSSDIN